ncbi:phosphoglucosamine mutase [Candidatus Omnitrophota bacterium]
MKTLFGTDGIRGEVGKFPLTQSAVLTIARALGSWLKQNSPEHTSALKMLIGKDTRESGDQLELALAAGAQLEGVQLLRAGICPTPTVAYLTCALGADLGIAISASHNPGSDNGIKLFNRDGFKLPTEAENQIEEIFSKLYSKDQQAKLPRRALEAKPLEAELDCDPVYIDFAKRSLNGANLKGFTVVLDCAFGSFSRIAPRTFSELGATVVALNNQPDGKNINVNCGALFPQMMAEAVLRHRANLGIAFDGDGDRVILSDEKGNILDGDQLLAILGSALHKQNRLTNKIVVSTQMSNIGLELFLQNQGIRMLRTKVGDKYVLEEMLKQNAILGGEQSGHILILQRTTTGDGLITALELINILLQTKKTLSALSEDWQRFPQELINIKVRERKPFAEIPGFNDTLKQYQEQLGKAGRIFVRYSGTEKLARVMVEGKDKTEVHQIAESLAQVIAVAVGLDK